jgi:hypothetical protein
MIALYGTGWQIQAENLATYIAGRESGEIEPRWAELGHPYRELESARSAAHRVR